MAAKVKIEEKAKSQTRIWVLRPGRQGSERKHKENESYFFDGGIVGLEDDYAIGDLRKKNQALSVAKFHVSERFPDLHPSAVGTVVGNVFRFKQEMKVGDMVLAPLRTQRVYRYGIVQSEYTYDKRAKFEHHRNVKWLGLINKVDVSIEGQRELQAARLFFECKRCRDEIVHQVQKHEEQQRKKKKSATA